MGVKASEANVLWFLLALNRNSVAMRTETLMQIGAACAS
ncbi:hypothetical protein Pla22_16670 [Rubripirellula amarantea]|uniref:Uncharacterized protein n=1 Tax=Rubripirellula amarantea TaxID=2527999 RepID=A0A5C5WW10_9BACT|nr:hypothetical protein Pla22_16670 [Rubripirellula amarantea]